ncbi:hypothetical protein ATSB10_37100 [Dyella thiooxydans]|uniref:Uncharacterized protein n=1 Tax=Dyella thiooxydans TaxID=445710 RepID=A0A160N5R9_9GAMM|nr:hypothetical protein ATSB10_37100 [Dyella thiooxydans]
MRAAARCAAERARILAQPPEPFRRPRHAAGRLVTLAGGAARAGA